MGLPAVRSAVLELARATLPDAKVLRDKAAAVETYLLRAKEAGALVAQAAEIRIRAERRIGELLKATLKKGNPQWSPDATIGLKQLGITKTQSSRWQLVASIPAKVFDQHVARGELTTKYFVRLAWQATLKKQRRGPAVGGNVYCCDLDKLPLDNSSVDLFLTDPPYSDVGLYGRLAKLAAKKLKPGKLCLAYCAVHNLPRILDAMAEHLTYHWTYVIAHSGLTATLHRYQVHVAYKPVLAFSKGKAAPHAYLADLIQGANRDKSLHIWQQPEAESAHFIEHLTAPGELVVDPFCGSGTVLAASKGLGRRWIGGDIDSGSARMARRRITA